MNTFVFGKIPTFRPITKNPSMVTITLLILVNIFEMIVSSGEKTYIQYDYLQRIL